MFLGKNLLPLLLLALGGALFVGNILAIVRPPQMLESETDSPRAPLRRSLTMAAIGFVCAAWAAGSLLR